MTFNVETVEKRSHFTAESETLSASGTESVTETLNR